MLSFCSDEPYCLHWNFDTAVRFSRISSRILAPGGENVYWQNRRVFSPSNDMIFDTNGLSVAKLLRFVLVYFVFVSRALSALAKSFGT